MKKILLLFALCVLAFGCSDDNVQPPPFIPNTGNTGDGGSGNTGVTNPNEPIALEAGQLRVISFNIRTGTSDKNTQNAWDNRKTASPAFIKHHKPTVFGLQEALDFQISYLKSELPEYDCYGVGREDGKSKGEHMSIFYRKDDVDLEQSGTFWLSETPDSPSKGWDASYKRSATWGIFKHKGTGLRFFYINTHLDHKGALAQENSILLIIEKMKALNPKGYPAILTADFNVEFSDPIFLPLQKVMQNAREVSPRTDHITTFNDWGPGIKIIDHIFFSGFKPIEYRTILNNYEGVVYVSDHYPISAVLEFEDQ